MKWIRNLILVLATATCASGQDGCLKMPPQIAFWKVGNQPEVVVVLHGGPGAQHQYLRPEFDGLSKSATLIYYDQRGCGQSDRAETYTWQNHVADLRRLIRTLAPKKKVFLAGSSWGSLLAILYAYTYANQVKGLLLTGTVPWPGQSKTYIREAEFVHYKPHNQQIHEKGIFSRTSTDEKDIQDTLDIVKLFQAQSGITLNEPVDSMKSAPGPDSLSLMKVPVLIFNGPASKLFDWTQNYMKLWPNAELHTFPAAGHDPWLSDPERFADDCNNFISKYR